MLRLFSGLSLIAQAAIGLLTVRASAAEPPVGFPAGSGAPWFVPTATTLPNDRCKYSLSTAQMTALHYAARDASAELIELLVRSGAATFAATDRSGEPGEYPLAWLERSARISGTERTRLAALLRVPDERERKQSAQRLAEQAEAQYRSGEAEAAYSGSSWARFPAQRGHGFQRRVDRVMARSWTDRGARQNRVHDAVLAW